MKGMKRMFSRNPQLQNIVKQSIVVDELAVTVDGATGVGFGTSVISGLPQGNILFLGAVSYLQFRKSSASGVQDTFDGDYSIGTVATVDTDVADAGEADVIPSTALGAATSGVSPVVRGANATQAMFDNTDGSLELNLNVLIDDANISADDQVLTATGSVQIVYVVLGDD